MVIEDIADGLEDITSAKGISLAERSANYCNFGLLRDTRVGTIRRASCMPHGLNQFPVLHS